jgi:hypothetical protein
VSFVRFYVTDVPRLGNVVVSRHAQAQAEAEGITEDLFHRILQEGTDKPDGLTTVWREFTGIRLVILLRPTPWRGARLVVTVYKVEQGLRVRKSRRHWEE